MAFRKMAQDRRIQVVRPVHKLELEQGLQLDTMAWELEQAHHRRALGQALHKRDLVGLELVLDRS